MYDKLETLVNNAYEAITVPERTFSLLTQVIGRAGRSKKGVAVIQTYAPKNEIIRLACLQDYEKFYDGEIDIRRELLYPPSRSSTSFLIEASSIILFASVSVFSLSSEKT